LFLVGGERSDRDKAKVLHARLFWLAVFGLVHGAVIWFGDILLAYAVCGAIAMLWRSASPAFLLIAGLMVYAVACGMQAMLAVSLDMMAPSEQRDMAAALWDPGPAALAQAIAAMRGDFATSLQANLRAWVDAIGYAVFYGPRTVGLMLLGLGLYKSGFFHGRWPVWAYGVLSVAGAGGAAAVAISALNRLPDGLSFLEMFGLESVWNATLSVVIAIGYGAGLVGMVRWGALRFFTAALADAGRMAFTNYLTQSIVMTAIFWGGRGPALFGEIDRVGLWAIVIAIWILQLIMSRMWLRAFAIGPLEWVWRSLSQGRFARLRKGD
jgi:uncharacterized protein